MKIKLVSDLHLEFSDINIKNDNDYDVLILGGDILVAEYLKRENGERGKRFHDFLKRVSFQFPHVVYVAGNHEFYNGKFYDCLDILESLKDLYPNIYFLENGARTIGDVTFIGCTLWTDMNKADPLTLLHVSQMMNDFRAIRNDKAGYRPWSTEDAVRRHRLSLEYISAVVAEKHDQKFVVVGHHSPSHQSIHPQYHYDQIMNGGYHSNLDEFILDRPQIKLWTHGHTHHPFDYMIGETRIVCNPRGYEDGHYSENTGWDPNIVIEV
jgi:Icc-related predicted phosphoesterase